MIRYKAELALATLLLALFLAVCQWQAPGRALSPSEIDDHVERIARLGAMPAADKASFLRRLRAWGSADDGRPVYMLNLMRYHDSLQPWPGVAVPGGTPVELNARYENAVFRMALAGGLSLAVGASAQPPLIEAGPRSGEWQRVLVVRYPSRRAFFELVSNPDYLKVMPYKFAAVDVALVPTDGDTVTPDLRLLAGGGALLILLAFGWWRSARRRD